MLWDIYDALERFFDDHEFIGGVCFLFLIISTAMGFIKFIEYLLAPRVYYETMTFSYSESGEEILGIIFTILAGYLYLRILSQIKKLEIKHIEDENKKIEQEANRISNQSH